MTSNTAVALSDLSFGSRLGFYIGFIIKTAVLFALFLVIIPLKQRLCFSGRGLSSDGLILFAALVLGYCVAYDIFFIITQGILKNMIIGMIISIIGAVLTCIIPPLGMVLAILGIISMVKSFITVVQMIPLFLLGVLITILLFADVIVVYFELDELRQLGMFSVSFRQFTFKSHKVMLAYIVVTFLVSINLAFKYDIKMALFRQTIIFLAIPIIALIVWLIKTEIETAVFSPGEMQTVSIRNGKVFVHGYTKANGTVVASYFRNLPHFRFR